ncbi:ABC transporter permease [Clostridium sp. FP1]|uniref:ABC transporter permease n=1 Tax=Clostridium sp. FP1 TaxID=2724076 RepID=UPI0013E95968|nr:ABC transporter permease [Clostridium sp. FP1]MBZ9637734.1 ABC transporter permease [Clostridium sp. FP1]
MIKITYFSLKNLKIYYFVPLIILYIFIPILNIGMVNLSGNIENAYVLVFSEAEKYIPILSLWWIIFVFKEYIEEDGNEILYCIEDSGKVKIHHISLLFAWYIIHVSVLFLIYSLFWDNVFLEFIKTVIQCFFFTSVAYMLMYTLKSTTISFMFLLIYELLSIFINSKSFNYISIFENGEKISLQAIITKYSVFFIVGILFLIIGVYKNKKIYY